MRILWVGAFAVLALSGCVVHRHHHHHGHVPPPPPPPPAHAPPPSSTVTVHVGWTHVRYSIWAEYYGCSDDEIHYLETCGYDDDDLLVLCYIARRARVPIRWVLWDYDRCGRSLYTVSLVYRLDPFVFYCSDVPRFYRCPPVYARAYGYYWRGERPYLTNEECHALVQLQIGIRYYGYSHVQYFEHHERGVQRADRHVFRTIVVRDHPRCGNGGKNVHETAVVKRDRAWEHRDIKEWEKKRELAREQVKIRHTPEHERQEAEKAKKAAEAEDRRRAFEEARQRAEVARREREESDKRHPNDNRPGNTDPGPKRADDKDAGRVPPANDGPARKQPGLEHKEAAGPPGQLKLDDDRKGPSQSDSKDPVRPNDQDRKGPPAKADDAPRGPEKTPARKAEDSPRGPDKAPEPPPRKTEESPRGPEKAPPAPPKRDADDNRQPPPRKAEDSPRGPEKAPPPPQKRDADDNRQPPPRKADDSPRGPEKAPPPPPPPKRNDDNRNPPPPPPQKSEERKGPEKPPPKSEDSKKESGKDKGKSRGP